MRSRLGRALPLLFLAALVFVPLAQPGSAYAVDLVAFGPASPDPPQPEPQPAPGPAAPSPAPEPGPRPDPAPGPTPSAGRPAPKPEQPSPTEPAPGPSPSACEATGVGCDKDSGWGFLDIPGMIVNAVTSFLGTLIEQVMKPIREFLADTLLATPDVTQHTDIKRLWTWTLGTTAGIYVLFVTAGGITVMGYETVQTRYALRQIAPRLLLGMAAAAASLTVMGKAISLSNALAHAIMASDLSDAGQGMVERVLPFTLFGSPGLQLYLLILAIVTTALVLAVLIGFLVRVAVMALLAAGAPLMLACHAHPLTDPVARLWWRGLAGCLVIQIAQSMTFVLALKLFFAPGATALGIPKADQLGTMLAGVALFWVLFKIPGWTLQVVLHGTPAHQPHTPGVRMLRHLAMYRLINHYLPGMYPPRRRPGGGGRGPGPGRGGPGGRGGGGGGGGGEGGGGGGGGGGAGRGRGGPGAGVGRPPGRGRRGPGGGGPPAPGPGGGGGQGRGGPAGAPRPGGRPRPAGQPAPGAPPGRGGRRVGALPLPAAARTPVPAVPPRQTPQHRRPGVVPAVRTPRGPRAVIYPAQARRTRQLPLPVTAARTPTRPAGATQLWLPIRAERLPAPPSPARAVPATPPPATRPTPANRARQLALPIPARRDRVRPPRPMQLRLPLEPPRR
ncbi:hypothetical protein ACFC8N_16705 [Streptomyces sp. NPDC055966]|uniref:hypothetical protein n=1 Tax=Streptomyces sp. NPDC055966 TaxID=3345669 RepID=UPI0035DC2B0B